MTNTERTRSIHKRTQDIRRACMSVHSIGSGVASAGGPWTITGDRQGEGERRGSQ